MKPQLEAARTFLFVPGHRPDRFAKAAGAGADAIVLDLEDAVAPADKAAARAAVADWLTRQRGHAVVRINPPGTYWFDEDLALVAGHGCPVMVPKVDNRTMLQDLQLPLMIPMVESAAGVLNATGICAPRGVVRAAFGSIDLATQLDISPSGNQALVHARSALVLAAAAAGIAAPIDGVTTNLGDDEELLADMRHARQLGYTGKLCIHPRQIAPLHTVLAPTPEDVAWASEIVAAASGEAVTAVQGHMVDKPVIERARRLLSRAGRSDNPQP